MLPIQLKFCNYCIWLIQSLSKNLPCLGLCNLWEGGPDVEAVLNNNSNQPFAVGAMAWQGERCAFVVEENINL